jgi:RimJ/RimL family protein N-acetyltransferase
MLEGELVRLRALERGDLPTVVGWINDPQVTEYLMFEPPMSLEDEEVWYSHMLKGRNKVYAIETKEGRLIGDIGLVGLDWKNRRTDIGIMIGEKDAWSRGYGSDAITVLLKYLFEELNLVRVGLMVDVGHEHAQRCYQRCGFISEGVIRRHRFKNGCHIDSILMSMIREDWDRRPG